MKRYSIIHGGRTAGVLGATEGVIEECGGHLRVSVERIVAECGYVEVSAFYRAFKRHFGYPPGVLRRTSTH